jgi:hypothetical protein
MTISHYFSWGLWPHRKCVSLLGIQSCKIGVGDKQERLDNDQSLIGHLFNISPDERCPLDMLGEHFLVPINARLAKVMYIFGAGRGEGAARC